MSTVVRVKYHGPTNTRGSRFTADGWEGVRVTVPYPYELSYDDRIRFVLGKWIERVSRVSAIYGFEFAPVENWRIGWHEGSKAWFCVEP